MLEATGLGKSYGGTVAVRDLTFTACPGRVTGFLGPNGAGKSTTMRLLLGLDTPDTGTALIEGRPYRQLDDPLRTVGALLDPAWRHPGRTARAHLRWLAAANGLPGRRAEEVLALVGLSSVAGKRAGQFSLGMLQRLGIATALLGDPRVLLFDEPVNGLDPEGVHWVRGLLRTLAEQGRTVFVSSHLLPEMEQTAQDLVVIGRGRLIHEGTMAEFLAKAGPRGVRVRTPDEAALRTALTERGAVFTEEPGGFHVSEMDSSAVGELAFTAGVTLHELAPVTGSLEQAYLELTGQATEYPSGGAR
ncbi:ABC-2 type transport system ATP-binding protein [Amycolatopsis sulphurea]|uniref:ABC-2 type transport system ATP-binding protein n=1 Tax=Amycolatopsis sulphurea TaxID=76022 RepID=A0A2A9FB66_9PSEU|nr:ATP-binding cassette domain-containing protein [Amycolatopsis sulphurea]PFG48398.1 ABC-2 type transport system ATP-binding protein [Amycolatopsis sulphurea]